MFENSKCRVSKFLSEKLYIDLAVLIGYDIITTETFSQDCHILTQSCPIFIKIDNRANQNEWKLVKISKIFVIGFATFKFV